MKNSWWYRRPGLATIIIVLILSGSWLSNKIASVSDLDFSSYTLHVIRFPYYITSELLSFLSTVLTTQNSIILLLLMLAIILSSKHFSKNIEMLMWPFKSVKVFGTEIEFNREATNELSQGLSDVIKIFRHATDKKLAELKEAHGVDKAMKEFEAKFRDHVASSRAVPAGTLDFRITIHLRDILFEHTFVQLLDYYPRGHGFGRRFPARYGIIGLTWRTGQNTGSGTAPVDENELIKIWAMFRDEAKERIRSSKQRPSLLCCILSDPSGEHIGVLYIDSQNQNEFGNDAIAKSLVEQVIPLWDEFKLLQNKVSLINDEIRTTTRRVRIHDI